MKKFNFQTNSGGIFNEPYECISTLLLVATVVIISNLAPKHYE